MHHPISSRSSRKGFALIIVLFGAVLVAGLAATLHSRGVAQAMVLGRIEDAHRIALGRMSVAARVAAALAEGDPAMPVDGSPIRLAQDGLDWEVRLADVEGSPDLYLSPLEVLALLGNDGIRIAQKREAAFADLLSGGKFLSEEQTLARLGFDAGERAGLAPFVTQRARTGEINPDLAPGRLRAAAGALGGDIAGGELAEITIVPIR